MIRNQGGYPVLQGSGGAKLPQNLPSHLRPPMGMPPEMAHTIFVLGKADRLCHIVQERRPTKRQLWRHAGHHTGCVGVHIKGVVWIVLLKSQGGGQSGNRCRDGWRKGPEILCPGRRQKPAKLRKNPLPGQSIQSGGQSSHGRQGLWLRGKVKPGGKADATKNPKSILPKSFPRLAYGTQNAACQVGLPSKRICQPPAGMIGHGVDGKIPAGQIFPEIFFKVYPVRPPVIPIPPLGAEGGNLYGLLAGHNGDGAVFLSGTDQRKVLKYLGNLPWQGVGAQVPVVGRPPQQLIPHAAAHNPSLKAPVLQPLHQSQNLSRYGKIQEKHPPAASHSFPQSWHKTGEKSRCLWKLRQVPLAV